VSDGPTLCEACDFVEAGSRKGNPYGWLCTRFPRIEGMGFVAPKFWAEKEPFMKCVGINGGKCCLFKPRRDGQMEMDT
jgi:hypothetical protein